MKKISLRASAFADAEGDLFCVDKWRVSVKNR